jgi:hypothetical protein
MFYWLVVQPKLNGLLIQFVLIKTFKLYIDKKLLDFILKSNRLLILLRPLDNLIAVNRTLSNFENKGQS